VPYELILFLKLPMVMIDTRVTRVLGFNAMLIGYARTSTTDQIAGLEAQRRELEAAGCKSLYSEQVSSVGQRLKLTELLAFIRDGDVVIVTKLDRLARSMRDLIEIVSKIECRGASLRILGMGLDTGSATGKLMLNVLGSVAEFEREVMLERQREGIAKARADGRYRGRVPTAMRRADEVAGLLTAGHKVSEVVRETGVSRSSVFRIARAKRIKSGSMRDA
jgi:DNA invertase Pin-like site-specific DNA recombinase